MKIIGKRKRDDVVDILCDICGMSARTEYGDFEYAQLAATWGYASTKDGEEHEVCLCESCYDRVLKYIESLGGMARVTYY